jgi:hypothetical protein
MAMAYLARWQPTTNDSRMRECLSTQPPARGNERLPGRGPYAATPRTLGSSEYHTPSTFGTLVPVCPAVATDPGESHAGRTVHPAHAHATGSLIRDAT